MKAAAQNRLPRPWDAFDAYLFDVDGTLLHCEDAVHYFAFCDALSSIAARPLNLDGVTAHGNTDTGILRDAFTLAGVPESMWRPKLPGIYDAMSTQVERNSGQFRIQTLPGARDVLLHLRARGACLGVATGNLERIGKQKLRAAGLLELFHFGAWSDGLDDRADVFRRALSMAHQYAGDRAEILVIGDTPLDVRAAQVNQLPVIAVATGIYSFETLAAERPGLCVHSLEELAAAA